MFKRYQEVSWGHEISHFLEESEPDTSHTAQGVERAKAQLQPPYSCMQAFRITEYLRNPDTGISLMRNAAVLCFAGMLSSDFRLGIDRRRVGRVDIAEPKAVEAESLFFVYRDGQGPRRLSALAAYGIERHLRGYDRRWSENSRRLIDEWQATEPELMDRNLSYLLDRLDLRED